MVAALLTLAAAAGTVGALVALFKFEQQQAIERDVKALAGEIKQARIGTNKTHRWTNKFSTGVVVQGTQVMPGQTAMLTVSQVKELYEYAQKAEVVIGFCEGLDYLPRELANQDSASRPEPSPGSGLDYGESGLEWPRQP